MNLYKINDEKFKSIYISINFTMPVKNEEISQNAVLASILSKSSAKYKTQKDIEKKLYELYGVNFDINVEFVGDLYNVAFRIECINKKYLPDNQDVLEESIQFLHDIIFEPNMNLGKFDEKIIEIEKDAIIEKLRMIKDDKLRYSVFKTEGLLCKDEPFGMFVYGKEDDVKAITDVDLYNRYNNLIKNSCITVLLSGNLNGYDDIEQSFQKIFGNKLNTNINYDELIYNIVNSTKRKNNKINETYEKQDTVQSVMTFGLRLKEHVDNDFYAFNVYNSILGATPSSKLFQNFREKESLAYTVRSRCYRFKGILIIYAGIERKNYNRAKEVIIQNLNEMCSGNISDAEFEASKKSLISDLLEWNDSKIAISKMIFSNLIVNKNDKITVYDMIDNIKKVTKQDVINIANRLEVEEIFLLGGEQDA